MDNLHLARLDWMCDNHPDYVRQLDQEGKLWDRLEQAVNQASQVKQKALAAGRPEDEANEMQQAILCPPDGPEMDDPSPEPVPYPEREKMADRAEAQEARLKKQRA